MFSEMELFYSGNPVSSLPLSINSLSLPKIMGVINLSPDSFFPDSRSLTKADALKQAEQMVENGADILDVGAESTRPGSQPMPEDRELELLLPVVETLVRDFPVQISVDTYKPTVAKEVLKLGVHWINDISGLRHKKMVDLISRNPAGVIIMHMQGTPDTMQDNPEYVDCVTEIYDFLEAQVDLALKSGISPDQIMVDPGIGFGKSMEHNLDLLANLDRFRDLGKPIVLGVSRKSFIGNLLNLPVEERLEGSLAAALVGVLKGADILRVHDVKETLRAVTAFQGILHYERT